jgi:hypothetical protein
VVDHGRLQPSGHGRGEKAQHRYTTAFIIRDTQNSDAQNVLVTALKQIRQSHSSTTYLELLVRVGSKDLAPASFYVEVE